MFTQTWSKYLPVIRILLKSAIKEDQMIRLNTFDFQKAATVRKAGYRFTIELNNGKVTNMLGLPDIAKDFYTVLLSNPEARDILKDKGFVISFNTRYELGIKNVPVLAVEPVEEEAEVL